MWIRSSLITLAACTSLAVAQDRLEEVAERCEARVFESETGKLPYRIFAPELAAGQRVPLVLFMHGAGERGTDNKRQLIHGVRDFISKENQAVRPCFVVAPQCRPEGYWDAHGQIGRTLDLLDGLLAELPVDPTRVYVTGLSMGGFAAWSLAAERPEQFAAIVPICGGGNPMIAKKLTKMPIWAFHGDADKVVKPARSRSLIYAIELEGGEPKYTEYAGVGHNSWDRAYGSVRTHEWLFAQRRPFPKLAAGDRVVFFGDSITQAGARKGGYIRIAEAMLGKKSTTDQIALIGAGISGHKVPDLQERLERDVLSKDPTTVVIYIGINDVWHWGSDNGTEKEDFGEGLRDLLDRIHAAGARVVLCTPSVIGERVGGVNKFDEMLEEYAEVSRNVAEEAGVQLLDLRRLFLDHLENANEENVDRGILTSDGVHLNAAGNRFVAEAMLEALGA